MRALVSLNSAGGGLPGTCPGQIKFALATSSNNTLQFSRFMISTPALQSLVLSGFRQSG